MKYYYLQLYMNNVYNIQINITYTILHKIYIQSKQILNNVSYNNSIYHIKACIYVNKKLRCKSTLLKENILVADSILM